MGKKLNQLASLNRLYPIFYLYLIQVIQVMSMYIRPTRLAAQAAAVRINEYLQSDNVSSDSDTELPQVENKIEKARRLGYDHTIHITRYLLSQIEKMDYEDQRCDIAEQLFDVLSENPIVFTYEPAIKAAIQNKIKELNEHIDKRNQNFKNARYNAAITLMKISMRSNINNSKMRSKIYKHLDGISSVLDQYKDWAKGDNLKKKMNALDKIISSA